MTINKKRKTSASTTEKKVDIKRTLIVIPTYNEIENLPVLLPKINKMVKDIDILIIDDNSEDKTAEWVKKKMQRNKKIFLLERPGKLGLGTAYQEGFKYAIANKYDYVMTMDADLSHNPKYLPTFLEKIPNYDIVLGSRYITGINVVNWPLSRILLSYFANIYARIMTGIKVNDLTGGYKCYRVSKLKSVTQKIESNGYAFQIEITYRLFKKGAKIIEIPIVFVDRVAGVSKMSGKIIREAFFLLLKLKFKIGEK